MLILLVIAALLLWLYTSGQSSQSGGDGVGSMEGGMMSDFLPPGLVPAVAQVESGNRQYDANGNVITSSAGAVGIMQLEPATAADLGVDPYDEEQNLAGGTKYLEQLYRRFGGDLTNTLAAYNWGPGNVDRALASGQSFPSSVLDYVKKVMGLMS